MGNELDFKRNNGRFTDGQRGFVVCKPTVGTAVRARGQDWLRYETERASMKDFVGEENDSENETDSVKTKADGMTFLFLFYNGT